MRTFFLIFFGLIVIVIASGVGYASYRLYLILPENTAPSQAEYPQAALDLLRLTKSKFPDSMPEWMKFSSTAAWRLFQRLPPEQYERVEKDWYTNFSLASVWVGLRWNEKEKLNTILDEQGYGPRSIWKGLEQASQGFFGVSASNLSISEVAVLIVNSKAFNNYDPWCDPDLVQKTVHELLGRYKQTFPDASFEANKMFARLQPRECERGKD